MSVEHGTGTVGHKSHDPCFLKKYMEAGVMTFVAHCTRKQLNSSHNKVHRYCIL